jgi:dTMP kinase
MRSIVDSLAGAMTAGRLITIEGIDGAGKSTLAAGLERELGSRGVPVVVLREPGSVELAERLRALVTDPSLAVAARTEALIYAAARAQLVQERLAPALAAGEWVLLDRFVDSSLAYQGVGRGLGVEAVRAINAFATDGLEPDRTLLLDVDPGTGRSRQGRRRGGPDRLEREDEGFFAAVAGGYRALAAADPGRIRTLDAREPRGQVLAAAFAALVDLLPADP